MADEVGEQVSEQVAEQVVEPVAEYKYQYKTPNGGSRTVIIKYRRKNKDSLKIDTNMVKVLGLILDHKEEIETLPQHKRITFTRNLITSNLDMKTAYRSIRSLLVKNELYDKVV